MKKALLFLVGLAFILSSCQQNETFDESKSQDHIIMSTLWFQKSSEMKALYYQCFNWAKLRVEMDLLKNPTNQKKAVVVDIDETMLNNSPFEGKCINTGKSYTSESWGNWTSQICAKPLPGAVEFSKYAESQGVDVFYISNRSVNEFDVTLKNLQKENFAFADSTHLLLMTNTSSKTARRAIVKENYEIILLIGDNMNDLSEIFEDRSANFGFDLVDEQKSMFGEKYIILPNPMYGSWEKPIFNYKKGLSNEEKYTLRKSNIESY